MNTTSAITIAVEKNQIDVTMSSTTPIRDLCAELPSFLKEQIKNNGANEETLDWFTHLDQRYTLAPLVGDPYDPDLTLEEAEVADGSILRLVKEDIVPTTAILVDDVAESVANYQSTHYKGIQTKTARRIGALAAGMLLLIASIFSFTLDGYYLWGLAGAVIIVGVGAGFVGIKWGGENDPIGGWGLSCLGFSSAGIGIAACAATFSPAYTFFAVGIGLMVSGAGIMGASRPAGWGVLTTAIGVTLAAAISAAVTFTTTQFGIVLLLLGLFITMIAPSFSLTLAGIVLPTVPTMGEKINLDDVQLKALSDAKKTGAQLASMISQEARVVEARNILLALNLSSIALILGGIILIGDSPSGWRNIVILALIPIVMVARGTTHDDNTIASAWFISAGIAALLGIGVATQLDTLMSTILVGVIILMGAITGAVALWGKPFSSPLAKFSVEVLEVIVYIVFVVVSFLALGVWDLARGI